MLTTGCALFCIKAAPHPRPVGTKSSSVIRRTANPAAVQRSIVPSSNIARTSGFTSGGAAVGDIIYTGTDDPEPEFGFDTAAATPAANVARPEQQYSMVKKGSVRVRNEAAAAKSKPDKSTETGSALTPASPGIVSKVTSSRLEAANETRICGDCQNSYYSHRGKVDPNVS